MSKIIEYVILVIQFAVIVFILSHSDPELRFEVGIGAVCVYISKAAIDIVEAIKNEY